MAESGCLRDGAFQNVEVSGVGRVQKLDVQILPALAATTSATTLTAEQSGKTILADFGVTDSALILPTATVGLHYRIVLDGIANATPAGSGKIFSGGTVASPTQSFWGSIDVQEVAGTAGAIDVGTQSVDRGTTTFKCIVLCSASTLTGGAAGDVIDIACYNPGEWWVSSTLHTTGTPAATVLPFDADGDIAA